jgi:hypothetical protein
LPGAKTVLPSFVIHGFIGGHFAASITLPCLFVGAFNSYCDFNFTHLKSSAFLLFEILWHLTRLWSLKELSAIIK